MPSKVEALIRNFLRTDGEALYLVPGEKIFLVKGTSKLVVGRENLGEESFRAVAAELVPGAPVESLAAMKHRVPVRVDEATEPVEVQFGKSGASYAIMICRLRTAAPAPAPEPEPEPEPPPRVEPRPAPARSAGGTAAYSVPAAPLPPRAAAEVVPLEVPETLSSRNLDASFLRRPESKKGEKPLDEALRRLASSGASDLIVVPEAPPAFRTAGELSVAEELPPLAADELERALGALLTERARRELESAGAAALAFDHPVAGRLRVRVARERRGLAAEFRRVTQAPRVEEIGVPAAAVKLLKSPAGLLLVAGGPASGRTITRAALLAHALGERPVAAVLLEETAEGAVPRGRGVLSVRDAGSPDGLAGALGAALASDAEVLSSPEPRDARALALLLSHAASRLVLAEVTARSVPAALERLCDLAPDARVARTRDLLAEHLRGVLVQRLVPLAAGGRTAVFDLLLVSGAAASLIRDGKGDALASLIPAGRAHGMTTMNDGLAELVRKRTVAAAVALTASPDPTALKSLLAPAGAPAADTAG